MTDLTAGAQDLVLAIFRLAVCDYLGLSYGHDGPDRKRRVLPTGRDEAASFLQSSWAMFLGDVAGVPAAIVWTKAIATAAALNLDPEALAGPSASPLRLAA